MDFTTETFRDLSRLERQALKVASLFVSTVVYECVLYVARVDFLTMLYLFFLVLQYTDRMGAPLRVAFSSQRTKTC